MIELFTSDEMLSFCKAMSSKLRIDILKYISKNETSSLNDIAEYFGISNAAVTQNIKVLAEANLVDFKIIPAKRGVKKVCFPKYDKILFSVSKDFDENSMYQVDVPIGHYTKYEVYPTCGLATVSSLIGKEDDPRYFDSPERIDAGILWMRKGFVEYRIPNYLKENQIPVEIQISLEISSEAPGSAENWPSDIYFQFNGTNLGYWTSPGDYAKTHGLYTPSWWEYNWNQYGLLKLLSINEQGTFIDAKLISHITIKDLNLDYKSNFIFRIGVPDSAENVGGLTIFGKGFGNYSQNIRIRVFLKNKSEQ
ncbi:MAG: transcriptional regulator, ArsR family [Oscillospiraceae bacterium]|nr:transcriptional regulator, ArsR family [Oscillospiraceae bacterium]